MFRPAALVAVLALVMAAPAAQAVDVTLTFREGDACPGERVSCIEATSDTEDVIVDGFAEVRIVGNQSVSLTVANEGMLPHNLTFDPGSAMGDYSIDDPITPGESSTISFTALEDVPEGSYGFYGGLPGHEQAGETGTFVVDAGEQADEGRTDREIVRDIMPGPGVFAVALAALAAIGLRARS